MKSNETVLNHYCVAYLPKGGRWPLFSHPKPLLLSPTVGCVVPLFGWLRGFRSWQYSARNSQVQSQRIFYVFTFLHCVVISLAGAWAS